MTVVPTQDVLHVQDLDSPVASFPRNDRPGFEITFSRPTASSWRPDKPHYTHTAGGVTWVGESGLGSIGVKIVPGLGPGRKTKARGIWVRL